MKHYDNNGTLASFESEQAMLVFFPNGLFEVTDLSDYINPPLTYDQESQVLNASYVAEIQRLSNEYNIAVARDGTTETNKVTAARSKITASDSQYSTDSDALIIKYFS